MSPFPNPYNSRQLTSFVLENEFMQNIDLMRSPPDKDSLERDKNLLELVKHLDEQINMSIYDERPKDLQVMAANLQVQLK